MTKSLPSLALDMSQDGIALHQLAFDGHWHELSRVALNDPALRARLANMRNVASKLEGRRIKTRIWLPREQIVLITISLMGADDSARIANARSEISAKFGGKPRDYLVQLGKRAEGGAYPVAAVRIQTLHEAKTFAKSHGFRALGFSTQSAVAGFKEPPVFALPADKIRAVGLGIVAATAATIVLGGGYAFYALDPLNLWEEPPKAADFAPFQQPNPSIERAGSPQTPELELEAPRLPAFAVLMSDSVTNTLPYLPPRQLTAEAQEHVTAPSAPLEDAAPDAVRQTAALSINWPAHITALPVAARADALPSIGLFSLQDRIQTLPSPAEFRSAPPAPSGPMATYQTMPRPTTVANTAFYLEPLPAKATQLSPSALAEFITRTGLSQEQLSRMPSPLLLIESKVVEVIKGVPPILPRLRSGRAIPEQVEPPVAAPASVPTPPSPPAPPAPLFVVVSGKPDNIPPLRPAPPVVLPPSERLPYTIVNGAPDIRPRLRPVPEIIDPPAGLPTDATDATAVAQPPEETILADVQSTPPEVGENAEADNASLAAVVNAAISAATPSSAPQHFALLEGQPALLPRLRSGAAIPPIAQPAAPQLDPATTEANALRPLRRPQAIVELPEPIDPMVSSAAPISAIRPHHRTDGFAANVARIVEISANRPRVTAPTVPTDPQTVNLPASASVARAATIENAINLRKTNLLGIYGTADNRTALIRLSSGRNISVQLGQSFSGWTVIAISQSSVRIKKRNREEILQMPAE